MQISHDVSLLDEDAEHFGGQPLPIRSFEIVVEAIYEAHVKPGWVLQPFSNMCFDRPNPYNPPGKTTRIGMPQSLDRPVPMNKM
jgi:porin